ncbi:dephospho-CoA kinase [Loktanella sp. F6476L]|uniref:dephospho-CoA kinase n=1 Tax=Loktanella sp. F6476L TaxID=2926405 RepID=UPI001FF454FB|nr:dephospho-CoA kinase [Loktanella sp. F6476L]MCK0120763.1 dephospho-CoA kinase [Loktanella sp. F6476L]
MITLGLTGSIGMGKSTTAQMFADLGVPVWDADAAVHRIYSVGGTAVGPVSDVYPMAITNGAVDRGKLKDMMADREGVLEKIQEIVHPLVAADRQAFLDDHKDADFVLLDIPLLFETGAEKWIDVTICVSAPADVQENRVLSRKGMTKQAFDMILSHQMPDADKRAKADHVIETLELEATRDAVAKLMTDLKATHG